jgi:hypothetical protein
LRQPCRQNYCDSTRCQFSWYRCCSECADSCHLAGTVAVFCSTLFNIIVFISVLLVLIPFRYAVSFVTDEHPRWNYSECGMLNGLRQPCRVQPLGSFAIVRPVDRHKPWRSGFRWSVFAGLPWISFTKAVGPLL